MPVFPARLALPRAQVFHFMELLTAHSGCCLAFAWDKHQYWMLPSPLPYWSIFLTIYCSPTFICMTSPTCCLLRAGELLLISFHEKAPVMKTFENFKTTAVWDV